LKVKSLEGDNQGLATALEALKAEAEEHETAFSALLDVKVHFT
jgi:hypothetical protein